MTAKTEAIANANAHLNNAGLPTYDDLLAALKAFLAKHDDRDGLSDLWPKEAALARAIIAKARGEG